MSIYPDYSKSASSATGSSSSSSSSSAGLPTTNSQDRAVQDYWNEQNKTMPGGSSTDPSARFVTRYVTPSSSASSSSNTSYSGGSSQASYPAGYDGGAASSRRTQEYAQEQGYGPAKTDAYSGGTTYSTSTTSYVPAGSPRKTCCDCIKSDWGKHDGGYIRCIS